MRKHKVKMGTAWLVGVSCLCILGSATVAVADEGAPPRVIPVTIMDAQGNLLSEVSLSHRDSSIAEAKATPVWDGCWYIETSGTERKVTLVLDRPGVGVETAEVKLPGQRIITMNVYLQEKAPEVEIVTVATPLPTGPSTEAVRPRAAAPRVSSLAAVTTGVPVEPAPTRQGGDTCATATAISALPFTATGTTSGYTDDYEEVCNYASTSPDVVYSYTPTANESVDITLCVGSTDYDTKLFVYEDTCASPYHACNDDACSSPYYSNYVSELVGVAMNVGHTYYIVVDGYGGLYGNYTIDVAEHVDCVVDCPAGANIEGETCGGDTNGGCNMATPTFESIALGDTVCGTVWADLGTRDTDWYEVVVAAPTDFTWTVEAEFDVVIGLVEVAVPGQPDCATATQLNPYAVGGPCEEISINTGTMPAGSYWFFVSHQDYYDWPCDSNNDYVATLSAPQYFGACCDDSTGICTDDVEAANCLPPLRFVEGTLCADLDPACGDYLPIGACCDYSTETCYPDKTQADCLAVGWDWLGEGTVCVPNPCLLCADETITVPGTYSGTTCGQGNDHADTCLGSYDGGEDYIYAFTLTEPMALDISMDPLGTTWTGLAIDDQCPPGLTCIAYDTGSSGVREIECLALEAGTYYVMVDTWPTPDCIPSFNLSITECVECVIECPPGSTPENEPDCGQPDDTVNGGCNSVPPVFSPITCGETVCGTGFYDGSTRDTDWYEVTVANDTIFTWTAEAEFDVVIGLVETDIPGQPDCASASAINPYAVGGDCEVISVTTECLPAGTYWFFVGADFDGSPFPCGKDYWATLTCETCVIPLGACCMPDGSCVADQVEDVCIGMGGDWWGEGTVCDPNPCPQPPPNDLCEDAIPVAVPSVTAGSTDLATADTGYPSCGTAGTPSAPGVWYSVIGTGNTMTADLCNGATTYDTKLTVYCMGCDDTICVDGNDDDCGLQSAVTWCSQNGVEYLILVHGYSSNTGPFELTISDDGVPCEGAVCCYCEGACCLPDASCEISCGQDACEAQGGEWQGCDTDCGGLLATEEKSRFDCNDHAIGTLDGSSPTWNKIYGCNVDTSCNASCYDSGVDGQYYVAIPIQTTVAENLEAEIVVAGTTIGDTVMALYCDPFDPANPLDNAVAYDDDGAGYPYSGFYASDGIYLPAGFTYWLVLSTFSAGDVGDYDICLGGHFFVGGGGTGACCLPDGSCADGMEAGDCADAGGTYMGSGTECATVVCPELVGACCLADGTCVVTIESCCDFAGRWFLGGDTDCGEALVEFFSEDFNAGLPGDWTVTDDTGAFGWVTNDLASRTNYTGGDGLCMDADADRFGASGIDYDTSLITPPFQVSAGAMLDFDAAYNYLASGEQFEVNITTDGGANWVNLLTWMEDHSAYGPGEHVSLDLGAYSGNTAQVAFRYVGSGWDYYVEVDNVVVSAWAEADNPCPQPQGLDMPGDCPKPFNRNSHGVTQVILVGDEDFDVTQVDLSTVQISRSDEVGGSVGPNEGPPGPHSQFKDNATPYDGELCGCRPYEGDGITDLSMKFNTDEVVPALEMNDLPPGAIVPLMVTGELLDGSKFYAEDCVRLVPPGTPPGQLQILSTVPGVWIEVEPLDSTMDGGGYADFQRTYPAGTLVTLTASQTFDGRIFRKWVVDGVPQAAGDLSLEVVITEGVQIIELEVRYRTTPPPVPQKQHQLEKVLP